MYKYLFLLMFLSLPILAAEPKFHFKDQVKIIKGFYRGCTGTVDSFEEPNYYYVSMEACGGDSIMGEVDKFNEDDLQLIKGKK
jgi:hypothetical protein